ncbi:hypothetical protein M8J76_004530 [Diaphorina citri]|nr:hypothetical protein M8J76_004530 [Diaphorina citri]
MVVTSQLSPASRVVMATESTENSTRYSPPYHPHLDGMGKNLDEAARSMGARRGRPVYGCQTGPPGLWTLGYPIEGPGIPYLQTLGYPIEGPGIPCLQALEYPISRPWNTLFADPGTPYLKALEYPIRRP